MHNTKSMLTRWLQALTSERGHLTVFVVLWSAVVVLPILGVVMFSFLAGHGLQIKWELTLHAYRDIVDSGRLIVIERTLLMAAGVTLTSLVIGFPFALWLAKGLRAGLFQEAIWMALTVPFFLDPSARTLVWRSILGSDGFLNLFLVNSGLVSGPVEWLLFSPFSVFLGLLGPYFPNMVWPIYLAILLIPDDLIEACRDLGGGPAQIMRDVLIPLAVPGIVAGAIFTFIPVLGDTIAPTLLGGSKEYLGISIASLVKTLNFAGAAAFATLVLGLALGVSAAAAIGMRVLRKEKVEQ